MLRFAAVVLLLVQPIWGQQEGYLIAGSRGVPVAVRDESGNWAPALQVGSFRGASGVTYTAFVPDVTTPGWMAWHNAQFRENGSYYTPYYLYDAADGSTSQSMLLVDTHRGTAVWKSIPHGVVLCTIDLHGEQLPDVRQIVNHITSLVSQDAAQYPGLDADQLRNQMRQDTLRNMQATAH